MNELHIPVLAEEFLHFFRERHINTFVDGTLGLGGHASAILKEHEEIKTFVGIDEDRHALSIAEKNLSAHKERIMLIRSNFRDMKAAVEDHGIDGVDGIFLDIGVSSLQLDDGSRGMSFSQEGPLDMRRAPSMPLTASEIVNRWTEKQLGTIFREYGEEPRWRRIAKIIVDGRRKKRLITTTDLVELLSPHLPRLGRKKISPMTLVFQALRIAVNDELGALKAVIPDAIALLSPGGRLGIISFHSLEDRIVKNVFRLAASKHSTSPDIPDIVVEENPTVTLLTKKPIAPSPEEIKSNPRSRSAKMRFIEKLGDKNK